MDWPSEVLTPLGIFGILAWALKSYLDYRTRRQLIEKGLVDEKVRFLYDQSGVSKALSNLKWGIVLVGIGLAALVSFWFPDYFREEGTIGLMFLFAGFGFLIYYFMAPKNHESATDRNL